jgi:hypothetical protein
LAELEAAAKVLEPDSGERARLLETLAAAAERYIPASDPPAAISTRWWRSWSSR